MRHWCGIQVAQGKVPQESRSTGDALPKRVGKAIETGNALVTEAKGLGRAC